MYFIDLCVRWKTDFFDFETAMELMNAAIDVLEVLLLCTVFLPKIKKKNISWIKNGTVVKKNIYET